MVNENGSGRRTGFQVMIQCVRGGPEIDSLHIEELSAHHCGSRAQRCGKNIRHVTATVCVSASGRKCPEYLLLLAIM